MADYAENILEAIEVLTDKKISEAGYDKTIKATISSVGSNGEYTCSYGAVKFTAYGNSGYVVNDVVMVNIPENNWDNPKMILNKVYIDNDTQNYIDPFSNFVDFHAAPVIIRPEEVYVKANITQYTSRSLYSTNKFDSLYDEGYTALGIGVSFKTLLADELRICEGTYGIELKFNDANNVTLASYKISSDELFGNIYNFRDYMPQKFLIQLPSSDIMSQVKIFNVSLYQDNDFYNYNSNNQQKQYYRYPSGTTAETAKPNIFASNLMLYLGYNKEEIQVGVPILEAVDCLPQYFKKWSIEKNTKNFRITIINKDATDNYTKEVWGYPLNIIPSSYTIYKRHNNGEWFDYRGQYNDQNYDDLTSFGDLDAESIEYKCETRSGVCSNVITFYQFKALPNTMEYDEENALSFEYYYKIDTPFDYASDSNYGHTLEEYSNLRYNSQENQLYSQEESLCPHSLRIIWNPSTKEFQDSNFLSGATITYKIPAYNLLVGEKIENKLDRVNKRFNFETSTLILHPKEGYEYGSQNDTVHYEEIDGISYLCLSLTLSNNFIYDKAAFGQKYWWGNSSQQDCNDMRAFTIFFRPKDYYLPTMINNKIYCEIVKDEYNFSLSFDIPIDRINLDNTKHKTFIFTEDMEKPYLIHDKLFTYLSIPNTADVGVTEPFYGIKDNLLHFCSYQLSYENRIKKDFNINILRPEGNYLFNERDDGFKGYLGLYREAIGAYKNPAISPTNELNLSLPSPNSGYRYHFFLKFKDTLNSAIYYHYRHYSFELVTEQIIEDRVTYYNTNIPNLYIKVYQDYSTDNIYIKENPEWISELVTYIYEVEDSSELDSKIEDDIIPNIINLIIPITDLLAEGYYYYDDEDNYVEATSTDTSIKWYTLNLRYLKSDHLNNLCLLVLNQGISSILEIPIAYYAEIGAAVIGILTKTLVFTIGTNKLYFDKQNILTQNQFGPQNIEVLKAQVFLFNTEDGIGCPFFCGYGTANNAQITLQFSGDNKNNVFTPNFYERKFLRYDEVGFTKEHAEVGLKDTYPSEYYLDIDFGSTESLNYRVSQYGILPIVYQQVPLYRDDFNEWNGSKVLIGDDAVYSPVIGAGTKSGGKFTGVLMGDVDRVDSSVSPSYRAYGLYGYKDNEQVFGLRADGTMFLGKDGNGQLLLNGNKATIQSANYISGTQGMLIDFDDSIIEMANTKTSNNETTKYSLKLDVSDNNLDLTDYPIKIGTDNNPKFYVDWTGQVHAKDVIIETGTLSGTIAAGNATINNVTMNNTTVKNITIQNSDGGSSLRFDSSTGDLMLEAGLKLGNNGNIYSGSASLSIGNNIFEITGGLRVQQNFFANGNCTIGNEISDTVVIKGSTVRYNSVTIDGVNYMLLGLQSS